MTQRWIALCMLVPHGGRKYVMVDVYVYEPRPSPFVREILYSNIGDLNVFRESLISRVVLLEQRILQQPDKNST